MCDSPDSDVGKEHRGRVDGRGGHHTRAVFRVINKSGRVWGSSDLSARLRAVINYPIPE